jgi:hypothetical protein
MRTILQTFCLCIVLVGAARAQESLYVRVVGRYDMQPYVYAVDVSGSHAYVGDGTSGFHIISVADPTHPVEVGHYGAYCARALAVAGGYAYVANYDTGLQVISVADPAHPVLVGECATPGHANYDLALSGKYVYLAGIDSGLRIISVADPAHPVEVGGYDTPNGAYGVAVKGDYAYVADRVGGLRVISVADPTHPTEVGHCSTPYQVIDVALSGDYAYVACLDSGLRVISVADPVHPVEVGYCAVPGLAEAVAVAGSYAFVVTWSGGLRVISIADPANPVDAAHTRVDVVPQSWGVVVHGGYVYVASIRELIILQFYQRGDLDVDPDSLDVVADTLRLSAGDCPRTATIPGTDSGYAFGEFVLANTSESYNPDTVDGPSVSPVDSLRFTGSLTGPGGTIDSILIPNLPTSLAQGQTIVCTLAVYVPSGMRAGNYTGSITITGKDTAGLLVDETFYALIKNRFGDLDVDDDSLDVIADTIRIRPRLVSNRPPPEYTECAFGEFTLANTSESYNPDTTDGPSLSQVDSLSFTGSLTGPGGTIDSILVQNLPTSLAQGQTVACTLALFAPPGLRDGDYSGPIVITGYDSLHYEIADTVYALVTKLGDLDIDNDSLDVARDTVNLHTQPAGPAYSPYAKARFMLVNTTTSYNPDTTDGPSRSPLRAVEVEVKVTTGDSPRAGTVPCSVYVLNLPESLAVGQAVACTLALVVPVGTALDNYTGLVTIDAYDTLGYRVRDSFFLRVTGPTWRQSLDSLRVAPIPFKPNQNPEHDAIHFQGLTAGARVIVYDASGQSVWSATEQGDGHLEWDAKVASGIYVYLVVSSDGQSRVGKLSVIR